MNDLLLDIDEKRFTSPLGSLERPPKWTMAISYSPLVLRASDVGWSTAWSSTLRPTLRRYSLTS